MSSKEDKRIKVIFDNGMMEFVNSLEQAKTVILNYHEYGSFPVLLHDCDENGKDIIDGRTYGCNWDVNIHPLKMVYCK